MKKLSLLHVLTFVFGTMPFSTVANTLECTKKVMLTPTYYDMNGENDNAEKYGVCGIYSESLFESDRWSDLTRYLEATSDEKQYLLLLTAHCRMDTRTYVFLCTYSVYTLAAIPKRKIRKRLMQRVHHRVTQEIRIVQLAESLSE